jgi:prolyl-tRNA editing enzyme YbaK/EbsC (Cys-tRNA(Pro) deacylase)
VTSTERLVAAAARRGLTVEVRAFPDGTRTAHDAAVAIGCDVTEIVKSLVFIVGDEPVVVLVGGSDRLDESKLEAAAGGPVRKASAAEVRDATGCVVGGVAPLGHRKELRSFADDALLSHAVVWAAAGAPDQVFASSPHALIVAARAQVVTLRHLAP